ncbi:Lysine-specific histone demethylase 1-like protein 1 [Wallemia ichthyophaga EXF-994]|uniref:Lysine-specific histone demethylase 1-like protein 1 n=1 Tax=Wallemia ichthyophaga (strain EXF-994 / CBS 113033) TaxID=1299270 RepID=R9AI11_WALI9|nr:Lysine-specific histone demethylase 1-like protein 1 [Wallemia ichthyophaga EXF-994]EOR01849.1 Lysine-specific histone demethylase 1-like protein 1 [Wallemia ichthyophaga EXF-994]
MPHKSDSIIPDAIVIGAGFSSAILTHTLAKSGYSVIVLEASERLGGRMNTLALNNHAIDAGCSFIHGYSHTHPLHSLAMDLGVDIEHPPPTNDLIIDSNGPLDPAAQRSIQAALSLAINVAQDSCADTPLLHLLRSSLSSSLSDQHLLHLASQLIHSLDAPLGIPIENFHDARRFHWEKPLQGSDAVVKGGYATLLNAVWDDAVRTGKVSVLHEHTCVSVSTKDPVKCIVSTQRGQLESKVVVCTAPLATLPSIQFQPPLPQQKQEAITETKTGLLEKLIFTYSERWWSGDANPSFTLLPTTDSQHTPKEILLSHVLNVQTFSHPSLLIYLPPGAIRALAMYSKQDVQRAGAEVLAERLPRVAGVAHAASTPLAAHLTTWKKDSTSNGATTTYTTPQQLHALQAPSTDGRLGFAGEHTEIHNHGSVNGAVMSGFREAHRVSEYLSRRASE